MSIWRGAVSASSSSAAAAVAHTHTRCSAKISTAVTAWFSGTPSTSQNSATGTTWDGPSRRCTSRSSSQRSPWLYSPGKSLDSWDSRGFIGNPGPLPWGLVADVGLLGFGPSQWLAPSTSEEGAKGAAFFGGIFWRQFFSGAELTIQNVIDMWRRRRCFFIFLLLCYRRRHRAARHHQQGLPNVSSGQRCKSELK